MLASTNIIFLLMLNIWLARIEGEKEKKIEKKIDFRFFCFLGIFFTVF
jgi:hypothetical protein